MIFPFLSGIMGFARAPVTWLLFFMQIMVYTISAQPSIESQSKLEKAFSDPVYTEVQGRLFAKYVLENPNNFSKSIYKLSRQVIVEGSKSQAQVLGSLAWRDLSFISEANRLIASEDPILAGWWTKKFEKAQSSRHEHPTYLLGVGETGYDLKSWISYQFSHSGWVHLLSNMIFLLIFGSALEVLIGGLGVLVVFLGAGVVSAGVFLLLDQPSAVPLIGASGAVSGLMALFAILFWHKGVRYMYFLLIPKKGYLGFVFLPGWVILFLWALSDLAGYLSTPENLGGVAYSAHLGGELAGIVVGITIYLMRTYILKKQMPTESEFIDVRPVMTLIN